MDAIIESGSDTDTADTGRFKSRPGALIWSFRKSRDRWKAKYQTLKATIKGYKNRLADLTRSRESWRLKAQLAGQRLAALQDELAGLRAELEARAAQAEPSGGKNPAR